MSPCDKLRVLAVNNQPKRKGENLNCIYLLRAKNVNFCLKLKEVNTKCPTRCPYFTEGVPGAYQEALENHFDIDCQYCTRRIVPLSNLTATPLFYCTLYKTFHPLCYRCFYAKYLDDPEEEPMI